MDVNGPWIVTTEGDEEGRTIRQLGIWSGPLDRVALGLADKACYVLDFEPVQAQDGNTLPIRYKQVFVRTKAGNDDVRDIIEGRPVVIQHGNYYDSYRLTAGPEYQPIIEESIARAARAKLTDEEYAALVKRAKM